MNEGRPETAMTTTAMCGSVDLSQNDGKAADRCHGEEFSHDHLLKPGGPMVGRTLSVFRAVNSTVSAGKQSG
jgi:hypothetical protein